MFDLDPAIGLVPLRLDPAEDAGGRDAGNRVLVDDVRIDVIAEQIGIDGIAAKLREPDRSVRFEPVIARIDLLILEAGQVDGAGPTARRRRRRPAAPPDFRRYSW